MAKKKVNINTPKVDLNVEKEGKNIKIELDTPNVDVSVVKDELRKEFHLDSKNVDIDVKKTADGVEVSIDTEKPFWKLIAKRIVKVVLKKFNR